jgi:serine/threonine protein kinase
MNSTNFGIAVVRRILIQLADALISLHSIEIIHRDLVLRNILLSFDHQTAYLCDLDCPLGSFDCPEIADVSARDLELKEDPYSKKSDVYMFGRLIAEFILKNGTRTRWQGAEGGNWFPPAPFDSVVRACCDRAVCATGYATGQGYVRGDSNSE